MATDRELLEMFKKVMRMSNRISKEDVAKMMKITQDQLLEKLFEWGDDLSFKIEEDIIVVDDISNFTDGIDAMFEDWENKEATGFGKVGDINLNADFESETKKNNYSQSKKRYNSNTSLYDGVELLKPQIEVLKEIASIIGEQTIPHKKKIRWNTFGFKSEGNNVIGLGLYKKGLTELPESIEKLNNIQELWLGKNKIKELPNSIGQLKNLQYINLSKNQLTTLPKSMTQLDNLKILYLVYNPLKKLPDSIALWIQDLQKKGGTIYK